MRTKSLSLEGWDEANSSRSGSGSKIYRALQVSEPNSEKISSLCILVEEGHLLSQTLRCKYVHVSVLLNWSVILEFSFPFQFIVISSRYYGAK